MIFNSPKNLLSFNKNLLGAAVSSPQKRFHQLNPDRPFKNGTPYLLMKAQRTVTENRRMNITLSHNRTVTAFPPVIGQ